MMPYDLRPQKAKQLTTKIERSDCIVQIIADCRSRNQFENEYNKLKSSSVCEGAEHKSTVM